MELTEAQRAECFTRLFDAHYTTILAYTRRRLDDTTANDAAADTFLAAWLNLDRFSGDALLWLYSLARRTVSHHHRRLGRISRLNERAALLSVEGIVPDPAFCIGWQDPFNAAFAQLSESEREVLRLVAWEGLTASNGAVVLGCSETAFKVRLHRARRRLRRFLDAEDIDEHLIAARRTSIRRAGDESRQSHPHLQNHTALSKHRISTSQELP